MKAAPNQAEGTDPAAERETIAQRWALLRSNLAALPRPVWILFVGTFVNRFGTFVLPFLAIYMTRRGFSVGETSLAFLAYGAGNFCASMLGGYLADRIGRRNTIVLSMTGAAISLMGLSQAESLEAIVAMAGLVGLTGELYRPACGALLADLVPAELRVTAFATYRLAINAGWAFGPATAGFLAERSFFWLFAADAVTSAIFGLVALAALPHGFRSRGEASQWSVVLRAICRDRRFLQVLAANFLVGLIFFQMSSTYGLHLQGMGYETSTYGLLISLNGLLIVFMELPLTTITQRYPVRRVMAVGFVLLGGGFAVNAVAGGIPMLAVAMAIFTFGEMICMPVAAAYIANLAPTDLRGRYMGLFGFTFSLAMITGPPVGMTLFHWNPVWLWLGCGLMGVLAAAIILPTVENGSEPVPELGEEAGKAVQG